MIYELRRYEAMTDRYAELEGRYRDFTMNCMKGHGIEPVAFWKLWQPGMGTGTEELYVMLRHESIAAREKNWTELRADPERKKFFAKSEANGPLYSRLSVRFLEPTKFSPLLK